MEHDPVEQRWPVPDGGVCDLVQLSPDGPAWVVGLSILEPAKTGARHELHACAGTSREPCTLQPGLPAADDEHAPALVRMSDVVRIVRREHDRVTQDLLERGRHVCEGHDPDRDHEMIGVHLVSRRRGEVEAGAGPFHEGDVVRVAIVHEGVGKPRCVAQKDGERDRLLPGLTGRVGPFVERCTVGCRE